MILVSCAERALQDVSSNLSASNGPVSRYSVIKFGYSTGFVLKSKTRYSVSTNFSSAVFCCFLMYYFLILQVVLFTNRFSLSYITETLEN